MKTIKKVFRNSYTGEDIFSMATYVDGVWSYEKEYVAKSLQNQGFGKKAVVIGNGTSRLDFDLRELKKKHLKKTIQTYGCNGLYKSFEPDFLVVTNSQTAGEVVSTGYCKNHVVYSSSPEILRKPGAFHLIPQDPGWNSGSLAAYLACFDGHPIVYLLGFDGNDTPGSINNVYDNASVSTDEYMALTMVQVFKTYQLVDFVLVNSTGRGYMPQAWFGVTNLRRISYRDLVLECDL